MVTCYLTALSPPKGAEGDLRKYRELCSAREHWHSPLPLAVPLNLFTLPFPRDRVDTQGLRVLPPLCIRGPVSRNGNIVLQLENPDPFYTIQTTFREIHGKERPRPEAVTFLDWKGLLLNPKGLDFSQSEALAESETVSFEYRTFQFGLYKIRFNDKRLWWEDFNWSCLWQVRKPSS